MSEKLKKHKAIGWDVDKTLINGLWSKHWRAYVTANVDNHDHWIVTFRDDVDTATVFDELEEQYHYPLKKEWFKGIVNLPRDIASVYDALPASIVTFDFTKPATAKFNRILEHEGLTFEEAKLLVNSLHHWKAKACVELGCTVLVDDLESIVADGCDLYNVEFINSIKEKYKQ